MKKQKTIKPNKKNSFKQIDAKIMSKKDVNKEISLDTLFEQPEADLDEKNDINLTRALSIPKSQVEASKEEFKDSIRNNEAETDYVKNADEKKQYCLYEGC